MLLILKNKKILFESTFNLLLPIINSRVKKYTLTIIKYLTYKKCKFVEIYIIRLFQL